jgi:uncharacterized protein with PIN domain
VIYVIDASAMIAYLRAEPGGQVVRDLLRDPAHLFRHGAYFDCMAAWKAKDPSDKEWKELIEVLREEIKMSRRIEELVSQHSSTYSLVHRRLVLKSL